MKTKTDWFDQIELGRTVSVAKTIGESDVYLFAGLSGDLASVHVNEEYMKESPYKHRIAHGVLVMSFMSWASTKFAEQYPYRSVSYGYDHVRFVKAALIGDTITVEYTSFEKDPEKKFLRSNVKAINQRGEIIAVAIHILKYFG